MKNSTILLLLPLLIAGCSGEEKLTSSFYKIYPEVPAMQIAGVAPACDGGFLVLGFHPDIADSAEQAAVWDECRLLRTDAAGQLQSLLPFSGLSQVKGRPTNLLKAPNGDLYFAARQVVADDGTTNPVIFRLQQNANTCDYSLSVWAEANPQQWLASPADTVPEFRDYIHPLALQWDSVHNELILYSILVYGIDGTSEGADVVITSYTPDGFPVAGKRQFFEEQMSQWEPSEKVNDFSFTPFMASNNGLLIFNGYQNIVPDPVQNNYHFVCWNSQDSAYMRIANLIDNSYKNIFGGILHEPLIVERSENQNEPEELGVEGLFFLLVNERPDNDADYRIMLKKLYVSYTVNPSSQVLRSLSPEDSLTVPLANLRFRDANNVLLYKLRNDRYLIAGSNREGGVGLYFVNPYASDENLVAENNQTLLSGGDFMPSAICEAANGDIVIAGTVLTFDRTPTPFLLRVNADGNLANP